MCVMAKRTVAPRGRPKKPPGEHHIPMRITLPPADVELLDEMIDVDAAGMETRSAAIGSLIRSEARRRARRQDR
jgi:hypothetical protein